MDILAGKKALCFIALPHHNRFLVPIMKALENRGVSTHYFTAAAEGAFEITLNQAGLAFRHLLDYADEDTACKVATALMELRPVLLEKILGNRVLQSVPLVIQDKVTRGAIESFFCIARMLEVEKPDLLFALHELNPWGKMLGYLSHVYRIPYFTLQEGLYYADLHYYRFHTDYSTACMVWGEECRDILLRAGCADDKIFPVGNTHIFEARKRFTDPRAIRATKKELGVKPEKKIVSFMMSHSYYQPFEADAYLRWMNARGDVVTVFKWHPATAKDVVEQALKNLKNCSSVISVHDFETYALIGASDVCITVGNSTTGLETLAFDKPLIEVRMPDQPYSYSLLDVAEQAFGFEDIYPKVEAILARGISEERKANVERYLQRNFAYRDCNSMERILELVGDSLAAREAPGRSKLEPMNSVVMPCSIIIPIATNVTAEALLKTLSSIAEHVAPELYEVLIVNASEAPAVQEVFAAIDGDVKILTADNQASFSKSCNIAAVQARSKHLIFLKPGLVIELGWVEGLLQVAEEEFDVGVVGGCVLDRHGLLWHIGIAFDVNQSPFSIYRCLPRNFSGAQKQREFRAVQLPFLVDRQLFYRIGGFDTELENRFYDIDLCLALSTLGKRVLYTPESIAQQEIPSPEYNQASEPQDRIRFYSKWTGSLWQNDGEYLKEDGLTHDHLSALYRHLAERLQDGVSQVYSGIRAESSSELD